jgi:predicted nuclease of restriction endonuclease-like (RecB) superfamily
VGNYLRPAVAIRERWTKRQFQASLFERIVLSPPKVSPAVRQIHPEALNIFRDAYNVEFLGLPSAHAEADLHRGLSDKLEDFLIELGRDFCFVASEYPLQVGGRDFALDLLFFHRGLIASSIGELELPQSWSAMPSPATRETHTKRPVFGPDLLEGLYWQGY